MKAEDASTKGANEVSNDDVRVKEHEFGIKFAREKDVFAYYKPYAKHASFSLRTQWTKRDADGNANHVKIGCVHDGKHYSTNSNASKP